MCLCSSSLFTLLLLCTSAEALVKYSFAGESEQELRLTPGDIITDVKSLPSKPGWSEGTLRGEKGCFPDSMVELHVTEWYNAKAHIFLCKPSDWLYCRSCHQLLVEAQEMSCCEGMFCLKCIKQWNATEKGHCPGCTTVDWHWHPSRTVERVLKGMHVLCHNQCKGCQWRGELRDLSEHLSKDTGCQYAIVCCPHNCGIGVMRLLLNDHVSTQCSLRPYKCQYCLKRSTYADIVQNHLPECPMHPVDCPNVRGAEGVVRQDLATHLSSCPLQSVQCSNGCGVQVLRRELKDHLMNDCRKRKVPCEYCKTVGSFEEIMGSHLDVCGQVPLDCPNKCSEQKVLRQDLTDHIEKDCPLQVVGCEFAHVGCTVRYSRRDMADHVAHSQTAHLSLVMARLVLCEKRYDDLHTSHEMLKKRCTALECENRAQQQDYQVLLKQLKTEPEARRLRKIEKRKRQLEHAASSLPPLEGVPQVFCVNTVDTHQWSSRPIQICNVKLTFTVHFQRINSRRQRLYQNRVNVSLRTECAQTQTVAIPNQFLVSFEMLHPENEMDSVTLSFNVNLRHHKYYLQHRVSCSPEVSTLIANTAHFKWERYMINQSLYFRVTASQV